MDPTRENRVKSQCQDRKRWLEVSISKVQGEFNDLDIWHIINSPASQRPEKLELARHYRRYRSLRKQGDWQIESLYPRLPKGFESLVIYLEARYWRDLKSFDKACQLLDRWLDKRFSLLFNQIEPVLYTRTYWILNFSHMIHRWILVWCFQDQDMQSITGHYLKLMLF